MPYWEGALNADRQAYVRGRMTVVACNGSIPPAALCGHGEQRALCCIRGPTCAVARERLAGKTLRLTMDAEP